MKKKIISLVLALAMSCSMVAFAAEEPTHSTLVTYTGEATESYQVVVPAELAPGESGDVVATGTWASNRKLVVTAPTSVTLTSSIDSDTKDLTVTFANIDAVGNNEEAMSITESISVAEMTGVLFGTWIGTIVYEAGLVDVEVAEG